MLIIHDTCESAVRRHVRGGAACIAAHGDTRYVRGAQHVAHTLAAQLQPELSTKSEYQLLQDDVARLVDEVRRHTSA